MYVQALAEATIQAQWATMSPLDESVTLVDIHMGRGIIRQGSNYYLCEIDGESAYTDQPHNHIIELDTIRNWRELLRLFPANTLVKPGSRIATEVAGQLAFGKVASRNAVRALVKLDEPVDGRSYRAFDVHDLTLEVDWQFMAEV